MRKLAYNAIRTPDGTVLESLDRHDFHMYEDKNGQTYGVDGGLEYLRRIGSIGEDLSVYIDEPFEKVREVFHRYNTKSGTYVKLKDIPQDWLDAIIEFYVPDEDGIRLGQMDPDYLRLYINEHLRRMEQEYD